MLDIGKILKRSWYVLWNYRVLWIFGFLLALTTGMSSSSNGSSRSTAPARVNTLPAGINTENVPQWGQQLIQWFGQNIEPLYTHPAEHVGTIVTIAVIVFLVLLLLCALGALIRYPAETASIRMVDEYEQTGIKMKFKQGWKLGWSRRAFRLWLIDLLLSIPVIVLVLLTAGTGLIAYINRSNTITMALVIGLGILLFLLLILTAMFISLLRKLFARLVALEGLGVKASMQQGLAMFKRNWKSAGLIWLITCGIAIVFGIVGMILFFLLIPAYLIMIIPAAIVAVVPGGIGLGIASIFTSAPFTWVIAALSALPFFFITVFAPLILANGWYKIFGLNIWTLTYREIKARESLTTPILPVEGTSGADIER